MNFRGALSQLSSLLDDDIYYNDGFVYSMLYRELSDTPIGVLTPCPCALFERRDNHQVLRGLKNCSPSTEACHCKQ